MQRQYLKLEKIDGPLIVLKGVDNVSYDEMMDIDLRLLKMCKAIYMLKNWEGSKGACVERLTALQLGMKIIYED